MERRTATKRNQSGVSRNFKKDRSLQAAELKSARHRFEGYKNFFRLSCSLILWSIQPSCIRHLSTSLTRASLWPRDKKRSLTQAGWSLARAATKYMISQAMPDVGIGMHCRSHCLIRKSISANSTANLRYIYAAHCLV